MPGRSVAHPVSPTGPVRFLRVLLATSVLAPALLFGAAAW